MIYIVLFFVIYTATLITIYFMSWAKDKRFDREEERIDKALKEDYREETDPEKKANLIDEGVQNIMSYEIKMGDK